MSSLSRLEIREILRCLSRDCEPEVVAKLQSMLGTTTPTFEIVVDSRMPENTFAFVDKQKPKPTFEFDMPRQAYGHLNDEEFEGLYMLRRAEAERQFKRLQGESFESLAPLRLPVEYKIERTAKGEKNSVGDTCVDLTPEGFSIFQCSNGHGYVANNPAVRGCTTCAVAGNNGANREEAVAARTSVDRGAIPGHDSNW
jgi:hypothetical protein